MNVGYYPEWVNGSPYCVEHAEERKALLRLRNDRQRQELAERVAATTQEQDEVEDEDPTAGFLYERFWR